MRRLLAGTALLCALALPALADHALRMPSRSLCMRIGATDSITSAGTPVMPLGKAVATAADEDCNGLTPACPNNSINAPRSP